MLEINEKQLLSYDNVNRARILKYIALGIIKFVKEWETAKNRYGEETQYKRYYLADIVTENM